MKQHTTSLEEGVQHIIDLYAFDANTAKTRRKLKAHIRRFLKQFTPFPMNVSVYRSVIDKRGMGIAISTSTSWFSVRFETFVN